MRRPLPPPGPLSAMVLPLGTLSVTVLLALVSDAFAARFDAPLPASLQAAFLASVGVMFLHKVESYWSEEYAHCPVYLASGASGWADDVRQAVFVSFVTTFLGMLAVLFLATTGPPWPLVLLTAWIAQGLHELHHAAKSLSRRRPYPGVVTSLLFVGIVGGWLHPLWVEAVGGPWWAAYGFSVLMPVVFFGFYVEDRAWCAKAEAWRVLPA